MVLSNFVTTNKRENRGFNKIRPLNFNVFIEGKLKIKEVTDTYHEISNVLCP